MLAGEINHTLKLKVQENQAVVEFENKSDTTAELRRKTVLGILDLRSMGYFKVGYQKMVTMAELSKNFQMHHYQQIAKSKPDAKSGLYFKMSCDRGPPRNTSNRSEDPYREPREDPLPLVGRGQSQKVPIRC